MSMKQNIVINKFNKDGFVIIKKVIEKAKIKKILAELPSIEKKAAKLNILTRRGVEKPIHFIILMNL